MLRVIALPALDDNYMYLLVDDNKKICAVVDPVEPVKVLEAVSKEDLSLTAVLTTHHHWDHAGGNEELCKKHAGLTVYGGDKRIGALTNMVKHQDKFQVGDIQVECLFTPCHTTGHICYYATDAEGKTPVVFTGDTLFQAGCGRFFEGTPEQMQRALNEVLGKLPEETDVYCGHEYTVSNLKFAEHVEPDNADVQERMTWAQEQRKQGQPTVPSTIGLEKKINPFMRVTSPGVQEFTEKTDSIEVMGGLRKSKDTFKPKK